MSNFIKIFNGKNGIEVEEKVNELAKANGLDIVNATSFMWQGVIYTTVVFAENNEPTAKLKSPFDVYTPQTTKAKTTKKVNEEK